MYHIVKIGDKEVPMLAMSSVNLYYKRVFGVDPIVLLGSTEELPTGDAVNLYMGMGFIMAKMAEGNRDQMKRLNEDMYLDWLDGFDNAEMMAAIPDISAVYNGQNTSLSEKKTQEDQ